MFQEFSCNTEEMHPKSCQTSKTKFFTMMVLQRITTCLLPICLVNGLILVLFVLCARLWVCCCDWVTERKRSIAPPTFVVKPRAMEIMLLIEDLIILLSFNFTQSV